MPRRLRTSKRIALTLQDHLAFRVAALGAPDVLEARYGSLEAAAEMERLWLFDPLTSPWLADHRPALIEGEIR